MYFNIWHNNLNRLSININVDVDVIYKIVKLTDYSSQ